MHCTTVTTLCGVLLVATAAVTGKPHQCFLDDYAKAMLAQYYSDPAAMTAAKPVALEYEEPVAACRTGRSNDDRPVVVPPVAEPVVAEPAVAPTWPTAGLQLPQRGAANSTIEKLAAYYDQLRGQQEELVREQLQKQLYAQQRSRQQEFTLAVQQMQQQYYQQQQHAMLMLEQLSKNPGFAGQLAAFSRQAAVNGTAVLPPQVTAAAVQAPPPVADVVPPKTEPRDQDAAEDDCDAKHLEPRQAEHRDPAEDQSTAFDDDQTPPVLNKVYSMTAE